MPRKTATTPGSAANHTRDHLYELTLPGQEPELVIALSFTVHYGTLTFWLPGKTDTPLARIHAPGTWTSVLEREP